MRVKFIDEGGLTRTENPSSVLSLTPDSVYNVLGIEADYFRLLSDDCRAEDATPPRSRRPDLRSEEEKKTRPYPYRYAPQPLLYDPALFEIVDSTEPDFWVCEFGSDGERYCGPEEWMRAGFFEDYHDRLPEAHALFWDVYYRLYAGC